MRVIEIGRAISVAPTISRASIGPVRIGGFPAPKFEIGIKNIANPFRVEGRVKEIGRFREVGGIRRHAVFPKRREYRGFSIPAVIAEAEAIVKNNVRPNFIIMRSPSEMRTTKQSATLNRLPPPAFGGARNDEWMQAIAGRVESMVIPFSSGKPGLELVPNVKSMPKVRLNTEAVSRPAARLTSSTPKLEVQTQQTVQETKTAKNVDKENNAQSKKDKKTTTLKLKLVEAVHVSKNRREEIKAAVKKAKADTEKAGLKITGRLVARFLSRAFWGHKSPIAGNGKDGSIDSTIYEMQKDAKEYENDIEAERSLVQAVDKHIPVKAGEGGRLATIEEVREVIEGREKEILRSNTPAEIVIRRVVGKRMEVTKEGHPTTLIEEKVEEGGETSLKDFPELAEIFKLVPKPAVDEV